MKTKKKKLSKLAKRLISENIDFSYSSEGKYLDHEIDIAENSIHVWYTDGLNVWSLFKENEYREFTSIKTLMRFLKRKL